MSGKSSHEMHAFKGAKIDQKAGRPKPGPIFTSVSQKKRYITIDYIVSVTSYQETQWPNFALKDDSYEFFLVNYPDVTERPSQLRPSTSDTAFRT